ncbi:PRC-barrel domain-containing protein [Azospirillum sp. sgz302134]
MRLATLAASAATALAAAVLATAAPAQTTAPPPQPTVTEGTSGASQPPLMTAPRPEDKATTEPTTSPSGVSGNAPSDEMQRPAPSVAAVPHLLTADEARTLVGREVRTRDGQPGGQIKDFTLGDADGQVNRIILAPNAEVGTDKKLLSVPLSMLRTDLAAGTSDGSKPAAVTLDVPSGDLARAPEYTYRDDEKTLVGKP